MLPEGGVQRIRLRPDTMTWEMAPVGGHETHCSGPVQIVRQRAASRRYFSHS
jgi:hypothetical protein